MSNFPDPGPDALRVRYCATCRTALDEYTIDGGPVSWRHTEAAQEMYKFEPHEPVPVPLAEFTDVNACCDFCNAVHPTFTFVFEANVTDVYQLPDGSRHTAHWGQPWASCADCAPLIEGRQLAKLIRRATRSILDRHPEMGYSMVAAAMYPTYQALLSHSFTRLGAAS